MRTTRYQKASLIMCGIAFAVCTPFQSSVFYGDAPRPFMNNGSSASLACSSIQQYRTTPSSLTCRYHLRSQTLRVNLLYIKLQALDRLYWEICYQNFDTRPDRKRSALQSLVGHKKSLSRSSSNSNLKWVLVPTSVDVHG